MGGSGGPSAVLVGVVTLALVAVTGAVIVAGPRTGGYVLAGVLAAVGVARAVLPVRLVGPFAVRTRAVDAAVCAVLAVVLAVITRAAPL